MFKKAVYSTLILIFTARCVATPSDVDLKTKEPESPTIVISPTVTENPVIETVKPTVEKICPQNAEIPINEIGLPDNIILLAVGEDEVLGGNLGTPLSSDILRYSGAGPTPEKVEGIRSLDDDSKTINVLMSPSDLWLAIFRWNATNNHETLWISTLNGQEQRIIADISPKQRVFWISDNEILVVGVPNEADYEGRIPEEDMRPLLSINPFTSETRNLEPLPEGVIYVYGSYHSIDGNPYSMYYRDGNQNRTYFLYDYFKGTSAQIFPWVDKFDPTVGVGIRPNGLYFVALGKSEIDFAVDLTKEEIAENKNFNEVMKHLSIENIQDIEISSLLSNLTKSDILILTSDPLDYERPTPIYLFDYKTNILKDYCINLGLASIAFSDDEQFVAFTINEGMDTPGYHVLLLNLKTGYYSVIKDARAIGFGKTD